MGREFTPDDCHGSPKVIAASQLLCAFLFGLKKTDGAVYGSILLLLAPVSAVAALLPARRAAKSPVGLCVVSSAVNCHDGNVGAHYTRFGRSSSLETSKVCPSVETPAGRLPRRRCPHTGMGGVGKWVNMRYSFGIRL